MKQFVKLLLVLVLCPMLVQATSLDGTSSIVYQDKHYVFRNFNTAKGYVRLNNGFTILAGQSAGLDTFVTVSGAIDLRTTGSLDLRGDLFLDAHVTWSSSGKIYGRGNTIHLGGSLSLPTDTILQFIDDTVIDGHGSTLLLGAHAQLLLASDVSLTLRNMTIQTTRNSSNIPIIRCFDQKGHVTLDNVELALADDFAFRTGRMFFQNDVIVTGTSKFIYQSVMQSYVASQSLLTFDPGTTLYYYPSSTNKDLIRLADKSSGIYLNGSATTLQTTYTGMRLTKGRLWMDNKVTLSTGPNTRFSSLTQTSSIMVSAAEAALVAWGPDGRFLAEHAFGDPNVRIFQVTSTGLTLVASYVIPNADTGSGFHANVYWHPSGKFLAITKRLTVSPFFLISVLSFNGSSLTLLSESTTTSIAQDIAWSPCGCYIAVYISGGTPLQIYSFNGTSLSTSAIATASFTNPSANAVFGRPLTWSPNGNYLGLYYITSTAEILEARVYSFNGTTLTLQSSGTVTFAGGENPRPHNFSWRPDGLFFLTAANFGPTASDPILNVWSFNGSTQNLVASVLNPDANSFIYVSPDWSPDGRYLAAGGVDGTGSFPAIRFFEFDGTSLTLLNYELIGSQLAQYVRWSPDGHSLAAAIGAISSLVNIEVYTVNYSGESTTQALTNGLSLGKSASGSSFDLDTYVLSGATVNLAGQLFYDSTS